MHRLARTPLVVSIVGLGLSIAVALSTLLPGAPVLPLWTAYVLLPPALLVNLHTAWVGLRLRRSHRVGLPGVPGFAMVGCLAWIFLAGALAYVSVREGRGQPTVLHHRYYLDDKGTYLLVTHAEYLHQQVVEQRIFSLVPSVLFALAALASLVDVDVAPEDGAATRWRARGWWQPVAWLAVVYGATATLAWGWHAGVVWILGGVAMMFAGRRFSHSP